MILFSGGGPRCPLPASSGTPSGWLRMSLCSRTWPRGSWTSAGSGKPPKFCSNIGGTSCPACRSRSRRACWMSRERRSRRGAVPACSPRGQASPSRGHRRQSRPAAGAHQRTEAAGPHAPATRLCLVVRAGLGRLRQRPALRSLAATARRGACRRICSLRSRSGTGSAGTRRRRHAGANLTVTTLPTRLAAAQIAALRGRPSGRAKNRRSARWSPSGGLAS